MRVNTESTRRDRLAILVGTILAVGGTLTLVVEGALFGFAYPLVIIGAVISIVLGAAIARSPKLAHLLHAFLP